jgi:hypothetical protein
VLLIFGAVHRVALFKVNNARVYVSELKRKPFAFDGDDHRKRFPGFSPPFGAHHPNNVAS